MSEENLEVVKLVKEQLELNKIEAKEIKKYVSKIKTWVIVVVGAVLTAALTAIFGSGIIYNQVHSNKKAIEITNTHVSANTTDIQNLTLAVNKFVAAQSERNKIVVTEVGLHELDKEYSKKLSEISDILNSIAFWAQSRKTEPLKLRAGQRKSLNDLSYK